MVDHYLTGGWLIALPKFKEIFFTEFCKSENSQDTPANLPQDFIWFFVPFLGFYLSPFIYYFLSFFGSNPPPPPPLYMLKIWLHWKTRQLCRDNPFLTMYVDFKSRALLDIKHWQNYFIFHFHFHFLPPNT